ncbi:hypothetical protein LTR37_017978 [Vermiconidia calcicola]|uniref:Uncharacterized protein n=1 Tax=Vermiconidia calcicola TaxID=1690605 RepID=A0ACC3MK06_9PEZI|nr:hypothetical protein LTR37_017978 [Vermiconidia calcicola]
MVYMKDYDGTLPEWEIVDVEKHTFKARAPYENQKTGFKLKQNDTGVITRVRSSRKDVEAIFHSREGSPTFSVPLKYITVGPVHGHWTITHDRPQVTRIQADLPSENVFLPHDFRLHVEGLLTGVSENQSKISNMSLVQSHLIADAPAIKNSANMCRANLAAGAPNLLGVINQNRKPDIHEVLKITVAVVKGNQKAGIYIRVYSKFPRDTGYYGKIYIYIGQTNNMWGRHNNHEFDMHNPDNSAYNSVHYKVARAAGQCDVRVLCVHDENEGGSDEEGSARRDLMELVMICMFGSYSSIILRWNEELAETKSVEEAVLKGYGPRELAYLYDQIAKAAFSKSGWVPFTIRNGFGATSGCNRNSPFGGEHSQWERLLWSRQELEDRWCFHSHQRTMPGPKKEGNLITVRGKLVSNNDRVGYTLGPELLDENHNFERGDKYYISAEVMKPGKGLHPVPHHRIPDLGPWNNWSNALKVAWKLIWQHKGQWFSSYIQVRTRIQTFTDQSQPGSMAGYINGVGIYAYFMRASWPNPPSFYRNFGFANIVDIRFDGFAQEVRASMVTKPSIDLYTPTFNETRVASAMEDLGLQNVNGNFGEFDWDWIQTEPTLHEPNGKLKNGWHKIKGRTQCDLDLLYKRTTSSIACSRVAGSRRCTTCQMRGYPCSWSSTRFLLGPNFFTEKEGSGEKFEELKKALFEQPYRTAFCAPTKIPDPGLAVITSADK